MSSTRCKQIELIPTAEIDNFLDSFDTILCDVDGVLRTGSHVIDGSPDTIEALRKLGKHVYYVSNSSLQSRKDYLKSLARFGYGGESQDMFTSSYICAQYLKDIGFSKTAYVLGTEAIGKELDEVGIKNIGCGEDPTPERWYDPNIAKHVVDAMSDDVGCVIVGLTYDISYLKLIKAISYLSRPDVIFLGTHMDTTFQISKGYIVPADGPFIHAIQAATGRCPKVLGKPNEFMFEAVRSVHPGIKPSRTLMIGDTPSTDMLFGRTCGLMTLMVGTGSGTINEVKSWETRRDKETDKFIPDYFVNRLVDLLPHITRKTQNDTTVNRDQ